jgi:hypothetical protein
MLADAQTSASKTKRDITLAGEDSINQLYGDFGKEQNQMLSLASGANMGWSAGQNLYGAQDLINKKGQAKATIRSQVSSKLMDTAEQLQMAVTQASRTKQGLAQKKSLLISQFADKYRAEAEAAALEREKIAMQRAQNAAQNKLARLGLNLDASSKGFKIGANGEIIPLADEKLSNAGFTKMLEQMKKSRDEVNLATGNKGWYPSQTWNIWAQNPMMSDAQAKKLWENLYSKTPYPGRVPIGNTAPATQTKFSDILSSPMYTRATGSSATPTVSGRSNGLGTALKALGGTAVDPWKLSNGDTAGLLSAPRKVLWQGNSVQGLSPDFLKAMEELARFYGK